MIRTITIASIVLMSITVVAQKKKDQKMTTTASGLQYVITQKGKGEAATAGKKVKVHYTGKLMNDTIFDSSVKRNQPFTFNLGAGQVIKGWDEGVALLHVGDKATFIIPAELGYGAQAMGAIPANSILKFDVELLEIIDPFFSVKGRDTISTESGLKYIIVKEGTGKQATKGQQVSVHYTGFTEDMKIFDSSVERGQPFGFQLGAGRVIKGWDEGIALMKVGDKMRLIIPYNLGYGEKGMPPVIPPKATLYFDVELMGVN